MKILSFYCRGDNYLVNEKGHIKANGLPYFSDNWIFLGGSKHHWATYIQVPLSKVWQNPEILNGCSGWDKDHGTTRTWRGQYYGKLPRISGAHIIESN